MNASEEEERGLHLFLLVLQGSEMKESSVTSMTSGEDGTQNHRLLLLMAKVCSESTRAHSLPEEWSVYSSMSMLSYCLPACHRTDLDVLLPSSSEELPSFSFTLFLPQRFRWTVAALLPDLPGSGVALGLRWLTCGHLVLFDTF